MVRRSDKVKTIGTGVKKSKEDDRHWGDEILIRLDRKTTSTGARKSKEDWKNLR